MPAPTRDASWDLAPACSTTAVRDPLVDTAKPCTSPAARLAAPMPIISWFGSTSSPRRAPKLAEVAIVSASDTSVMPMAATINGATSASFVQGNDGAGTPRGKTPTVFTPCALKSRTAETTVAPTTATRTAGTRRVTFGKTSRTASTPRPVSRAGQTVRSRLVKKARTSWPKPSASVEKPNSFGSWPTMMIKASPFMYPTWTSLESRSATNPNFATPRPISISGDDQGEHARQRDSSRRAPASQKRA